MERIQQTATRVNTIRPAFIGEPASHWRSYDRAMTMSLVISPTRDTEAVGEMVRVVGGGMLGKGVAVNTGDLSGQEAGRSLTGVRAVIVAMKPGNSGGAKGGRLVRAFNGLRGSTTGGLPKGLATARDKCPAPTKGENVRLTTQIADRDGRDRTCGAPRRDVRSGREARKGRA
jgi:hypothetical protein